MSRGPSNVTSTTNSEPPAFLLGPLTTAANAAQNSFLGRDPTAPVAGPAGRFGGPFGRFGGRGGEPPDFFPPPAQNTPPTDPGGSGIIGQAQGVVGNTLAGDFLSPSSNPFLKSTFNRAADLTRTRLSSEFAGSGRDLGAARPARSEELQTLASNIFGQNFQAERDRQLAAVDQAQSLDPINMLINRLAGIIPGAGGSTQSTQPVFRTGIF